MWWKRLAVIVGTFVVFLLAIVVAMGGWPDFDDRVIAAHDELTTLPPNKRLIVASGGRRSCLLLGEEVGYGPKMRDMMEYMRALSAEGTTLIITCFADVDDPPLYVTVTPGPKTHYLMTPDALARLIRTFDGPIHLYGHSYGGWLALRTALAIVDVNPPAALVTVDAISPKTCHLAAYLGFAWARVKGIDPRGPWYIDGCNTFPTDFPPETLRQLTARVPRWLNIYQTQLAVLHSSRTDAAHQNIEVYSPRSVWKLNSHDATIVHPRALAAFKALLR